MRTTLDLDEDILGIAKEMAAQRKSTAGKVISELVRKALKPKRNPKYRNGIRLLEPKPGATPPTLEQIREWRDEL